MQHQPELVAPLMRRPATVEGQTTEPLIVSRADHQDAMRIREWVELSAK
jgi:hypothetical protein